MKWMLVTVAMLGLAGCVTQPIGPQTREAWTALHTHQIKGVTPEQVLDASQKVLQLADHDFTFDFPQGKLIASRKWSVYMVIAAAFGTDYWNIEARPIDGGTEVTVQISRQSGAITPSPTVGLTGGTQGAIGVGAGSSTMPGENITGPFPYELFWARLDYMLGLSKSWTTCKAAESLKKGREKMYSDVLCSVSTDDRTPS